MSLMATLIYLKHFYVNTTHILTCDEKNPTN
jgi:hypothetical protein